MECNQIARRTNEALAEKSRRDGEAGGRLPYGYMRVFDIVDSKNGPVRKAVGIEIDEEAAAVVRTIFHLREQRQTLRAIAKTIRDVTTLPGPQGGEWTFSTVQDILANADAYRGGKRGTSNVTGLLGVNCSIGHDRALKRPNFG